MRDPVRVLRALRLDADLDQLAPALNDLWSAIEAEGLDRPLTRPTSKPPTVEDLQLVAWELIVGPEGIEPPLRLD